MNCQTVGIKLFTLSLFFIERISYLYMQIYVNMYVYVNICIYNF